MIINFDARIYDELYSENTVFLSLLFILDIYLFIIHHFLDFYLLDLHHLMPFLAFLHVFNSDSSI